MYVTRGFPSSSTVMFCLYSRTSVKTYLSAFVFFNYLTLSLILCRDVVAARELGRLCSVRAGVLPGRSYSFDRGDSRHT